MATIDNPTHKPAAAAIATNANAWRVEPRDRELFQRELRGFVPPGAFDAHAHLYDMADLNPDVPLEAFGGPTRVGFDTFLNCQKRWMGDRQILNGLFFPFPKRGLDPAANNDLVAEELTNHPGSRGLMMIRPHDDPAAVEADVKKRRWAGFKVYHVHADRSDSFNADQREFLPEWAWEIADRHGLWITMHLVLPRALADPRNQKYTREHCIRYPNARIVLAHAARGFCAAHTIEGIESLRGVQNVFFDTSAVCEPGAFSAILQTFGPTRLMYGSDFGISELRGRAVSLNDGFFWLFEDNVQWNNWKHGTPTLVGIESLLALRQACRDQHLSDTDVERIFSTNARQLLGLEK